MPSFHACYCLLLLTATATACYCLLLLTATVNCYCYCLLLLTDTACLLLLLLTATACHCLLLPVTSCCCYCCCQKPSICRLCHSSTRVPASAPATAPDAAPAAAPAHRPVSHQAFLPAVSTTCLAQQMPLCHASTRGWSSMEGGDPLDPRLARATWRAWGHA